MTRSEHRAKAEEQLAEAERLVSEKPEKFGSYEPPYAFAAHLRQCAMVHAILGSYGEED